MPRHEFVELKLTRTLSKALTTLHDNNLTIVSSMMEQSTMASLEPFLKGDSGRNTRGLLRLIILCTIAAAAVASRLFSVIRTFLHPSHSGILSLQANIGRYRKPSLT
jgi:hypothetical protein